MSDINGSSRIQDGTVEGLLQFLDYVVAKGYGPVSAVSPWRSAVRQVVSAVERTDDIQGVDVKGLDVDGYLDRFETLARGDLKVESIQAYRRRFTNAVEAYTAFVDTGKPPTFRGRGARRPKAEAAGGKSAAVKAPAATATATAPTPAPEVSRERMIEYPFPLRSGSVATIRLPVTLEKVDAERLAAFIRTLVFEPVLEIGPAEDDDPELSLG